MLDLFLKNHHVHLGYSVKKYYIQRLFQIYNLNLFRNTDLTDPDFCIPTGKRAVQ